MNVIISNSTPLIAFARIGQLVLLRNVVGKMIIPQAVADEISEYAQAKPGGINLAQEDWITVQSVQSEQQVRLLLPTLDRGEAEVVALALERQARLVLIDELTGRKVAESLNLNVSGSVGILIRAKQMGQIPYVKPLLDEMKRQGIYFSQRFIDAVLRNVGEIENGGSKP
jgi:predicted nucleic acid-binding protein